ncbi:hypothetical protein JQ633_02175 [Bradyrhizobium tropiciagri]|uniref:hypothetical protein n=1 Tax=Bradyrhizobium tropiciagri TaxID=312253 RepID=UPI001BA453CE|nr:hypothetical protein [Bradyrhizobium tropiciagri]MBR0869149.1 hypothetical protein [Bradyrhizobium tropiciagri]
MQLHENPKGAMEKNLRLQGSSAELEKHDGRHSGTPQREPGIPSRFRAWPLRAIPE